MYSWRNVEIKIRIECKVIKSKVDIMNKRDKYELESIYNEYKR